MRQSGALGNEFAFAEACDLLIHNSLFVIGIHIPQRQLRAFLCRFSYTGEIALQTFELLGQID